MKSTAMGKITIFSVVLTLFLLVPASITWAQVTKTLNGTVRYESGMSETKFSTPNGDVVMKLPQSLSGAVITGTVSAEPAGSTEKEKSKNLEELLKFVVKLDGQQIPFSATPQNFDWVTHLDRQQRTVAELFHVSGVKAFELSLPPVLSAPAISNPGNAPRLSTPSKVLLKGDKLNVYTNQQFKPGEKFVLTDANGQQFTVKPICLSSNQAVMNVPDGVSLGNCSVSKAGSDAPILDDNAEHARFNLIDINLTSPNTNLRPGELSNVLVQLNTGPAPPLNDRIADMPDIWGPQQIIPIQIRIDLRNLNPNTVTMEGGNLQRAYASSSRESYEYPGSYWQIRRNITGNAVGSFSVSATLHEDYTTSNDPFRPQLNVLKTPEDFNAWSTALKKDLKEYAGMHDNDLFGQTAKTNAQRAIDNMPTCSDPGQLDESKAVAYSLLQPLQVPKGAAINWLSSFEATKAAAKAIDNTLAGNTELIDYDVLKNGTEFINRIGEQLKDASLQTQCNNVQQLIDAIQTGAETKENLQDLKNKMNALTSKAGMKIDDDPPIIIKTGMKDLIMSSYQLPSLARPGRVHPYNDLIGFLNPDKKTLFVLPEYKSIALSMINARPLENGQYHINSMTLNRKPIAYDIAIVVANQFLLFDEAEKKPDETKKDEVKTEPKKEPGTFVKKFFTGSVYCFLFKDAECVHERDAKKDDVCTLVPGSKPDDPNASYMKTEYLARGYCKKGTGTCIEMETVDYITHLYADKNCKILLGVTSHSSYSCE